MKTTRKETDIILRAAKASLFAARTMEKQQIYDTVGWTVESLKETAENAFMLAAAIKTADEIC